MNTVRMKASQIYKDWHVIDAADRPLGRVATEAATLLRGKHKPTFEPHLDGGDFVIVVNAAKVRVTGNKEQQLVYYRHSGYPGGLRKRTYVQQRERFPERILQQAIWGMLPGGPLGKKMLKHLKVYAGPEHPHASQIAATQKAQAARAEASEALAMAPLKAPRLRPLTVALAPAADVRPEATEETPAPAARARGKAPKAAAATTTSVELEASEDTVLTDQSPVPAEATLNEETVVAENPTPAEAAVAQGEPIAEEKPKRTRKKLSEETSGEAGDTPKPRTRRAKAETGTTVEATGEEKKPARRRKAQTEETEE